MEEQYLKVKVAQLLKEAIGTDRRQGAFRFTVDKFKALYRALIMSPRPVTADEATNIDNELYVNVLGWEDLHRFISVAEPTGLIKITHTIPKRYGTVLPGMFRLITVTDKGLLNYADITGDKRNDLFKCRLIQEVCNNIPGLFWVADATYEYRGLAEKVKIHFDSNSKITTEPEVYAYIFEQVFKAGAINGSIQDPDFAGKVKSFLVSEDTETEPTTEGEFNPYALSKFQLKLLVYSIAAEIDGIEGAKLPGGTAYKTFEKHYKQGVRFKSEKDFKEKLTILLKG